MERPKGFIVSRELVAGMLSYNLLVWLVFTLVYYKLDFVRHFDVPDNYSHSLDTSMYFAWQISSQMFGTNIIPKTRTGRTLVAIHGVLAWTQTIIFLAPWAIFPMRVAAKV